MSLSKEYLLSLLCLSVYMHFHVLEQVPKSRNGCPLAWNTPSHMHHVDSLRNSGKLVSVRVFQAFLVFQQVCGCLFAEHKPIFYRSLAACSDM